MLAYINGSQLGGTFAPQETFGKNVWRPWVVMSVVGEYCWHLVV